MGSLAGVRRKAALLLAFAALHITRAPPPAPLAPGPEDSFARTMSVQSSTVFTRGNG